jgi:hypothetical protein
MRIAPGLRGFQHRIPYLTQMCQMVFISFDLSIAPGRYAMQT